MSFFCDVNQAGSGLKSIVLLLQIQMGHASTRAEAREGASQPQGRLANLRKFAACCGAVTPGRCIIPEARDSGWCRHYDCQGACWGNLLRPAQGAALLLPHSSPAVQMIASCSPGSLTGEMRQPDPVFKVQAFAAGFQNK